MYVGGGKWGGEEHSNFNLSDFGWKGKKKKQNTKWSGYLLIFPFLTPPDGASLQSFFVPFTEFPFCRLFLPFSFYSPNASFIILFPLLWAAGQYNIRKCSNSDPLFNILKIPPSFPRHWEGGHGDNLKVLLADFLFTFLMRRVLQSLGDFEST